MSKIESINIANKSNETTFYVNQVYLEKDKGIVNDRYYEKSKNGKKQVTLIDIEEIDLFNKKTNTKIDYKDFRRNIIVSGFGLCKIVGEKIKIDDVILEIYEICQPCRGLQEKLKLKNYVKDFVNKSGVRANILASGYINVNSKILKI